MGYAITYIKLFHVFLLLYAVVLKLSYTKIQVACHNILNYQ
jgi:hypothetical protein